MLNLRKNLNLEKELEKNTFNVRTVATRACGPPSSFMFNPEKRIAESQSVAKHLYHELSHMHIFFCPGICILIIGLSTGARVLIIPSYEKQIDWTHDIAIHLNSTQNHTHTRCDSGFNIRANSMHIVILRPSCVLTTGTRVSINFVHWPLHINLLTN